MFCVFGSFVLNGDPTIKQFGLGLATAVAIDALVVCLFVPALITVAGRSTIWFPHWLDGSCRTSASRARGISTKSHLPAGLRHPSRSRCGAPEPRPAIR